MRRAANSSNEYTSQQISATKILGSSSDSIDGTCASIAKTTPAMRPIVRKTQPTTIARWFIWLERIHEPADQRDEDLGVVKRQHRRHLRLDRKDDAGAEADRQKDPADDDRALVHLVDHLQRRQPRVEDAEMLRLDFLEQQHVCDADDAGQREAGAREQQIGR